MTVAFIKMYLKSELQREAGGKKGRGIFHLLLRSTMPDQLLVPLHAR